jgi:hypothetical protein
VCAAWGAGFVGGRIVAERPHPLRRTGTTLAMTTVAAMLRRRRPLPVMGSLRGLAGGLPFLPCTRTQGAPHRTQVIPSTASAERELPLKLSLKLSLIHIISL